VGPSLPSSAIISQYEMLRMAALGNALAPESRTGLALFLCRGMWAWAKTLAVTTPRQVPMPPLPLSLAAPCDHSIVIHLLATMAMEIDSRRSA
jgi:hypothetical protein